MIVLSLQEALNALGETRLIEDLKYMSEVTYKLWYEKYYRHNLDKFPTWNNLYHLFMNIAKETNESTYYNCYVSIRDNHIIGFISLNYNDFDIFVNDQMNKNTLWLTDLYVWKDFRGKGISSILIEHVKNIANNKKIDLYLACEDSLVEYYAKYEFKKVDNYNKIYNIKNNKYNKWNFMSLI
jgi:GNAT superfamily N-acetyltransferase